MIRASKLIVPTTPVARGPDFRKQLGSTFVNALQDSVREMDTPIVKFE